MIGRRAYVTAAVLAGVVMTVWCPWVRAGKKTDVRADDFWTFYEQYPQFQTYYPFGVYGDQGRWTRFGTSPEVFTRMIYEVIREAGMNTIWGANLHRNLVDRHTVIPPKLSAFGRWAYGEMRFHEFKVLPTLQPWVGQSWGKVFSALAKKRGTKPLTPKDLADAERELKPVLQWADGFAKQYPDTIVGWIFDDEPSYLLPSLAAVDLIKKHTGMPATTCLPSWAGFKYYAPHLQPVGGDWYPTGDAVRNSWAVARNLRWLQKHHPDRVFWFVPLGGAYPGGHEQSLPGLRDARPLRTEMRMQFWQAVAWGCKGFYYYHIGGGSLFWAAGEDTVANVLLQPNTHNLLGELRELAPQITTIGPLLLSCRPDVSVTVPIKAGRVRFPEFEGPAVEAGLLKDIKHKRHFLVPYNNDIVHPQTATISLPPKLMAGRQVYDLHDLKAVPAGSGRQVRVTLPPGGGRIFLLADAAQFAACRDVVLRHRADNARVVCKLRMRLAVANRLDLKAAEAILAKARAAHQRADWAVAADTYTRAAAAIDKAIRTDRYLKPTVPALGVLARVLSETDDWLRTHIDVLGLPRASQHIHYAHYPMKDIGRDLRRWGTLVQAYYDAHARYRAGLGRHGFRVYDYVADMVVWAKENRDAIRAKIDRRLKQQRKPLKLALVTIDRHDLESVQQYVWAYKKLNVTWFCPNSRGQLADAKNRALRPSDYDVVWIHQHRYAAVPEKGKPADPARVLWPALVKPATVKVVRAYVDGGGGLLLTGIAGLYAQVLGIEKTAPNRVRESSFYRPIVGGGLRAAAGFSKHPAFGGLDPKGFFTNGNWYEQNLVPECAWQKRKPSGLVIADQIDKNGPQADYAPVVEYRPGKGTVVVMGGTCCDLTPGVAYTLPRKDNHYQQLRKRLRRFVLNVLCYLGSHKRFAPDAEAMRRAATDAKVEAVALPIGGWLFRPDPKNVGMKDKWYRPGLDTSTWKTVRVDQPWEMQGFPEHDGYGWYRLMFTGANRPGQRTLVHFGGVDETAVVWIDGKLVGKHDEGLSGWDKPFAMDITRFLTGKPAAHLLAVQAHDDRAAGGVWRPVSLRYVPGGK